MAERTNLILPLSLAATVVFSSLFTHSFLDTPRNLPTMNRVLWALVKLLEDKQPA